MPSAPPANIGRSSVPALPKIATAAAARSASVGNAAIDAAIASNRSAALLPLSSSIDSPIASNAARADADPPAALTNAISAFVAALAIVS